MTPLSDAIARAEDELSQHAIQDVQTLTAYTWAGRAIVAYRRYALFGIGKWLIDALEYHHEALEHAAEASPEVIASLRMTLSNEARAAGVDK
jgi:hypothetical protein